MESETKKAPQAMPAGLFAVLCAVLIIDAASPQRHPPMFLDMMDVVVMIFADHKKLQNVLPLLSIREREQLCQGQKKN